MCSSDLLARLLVCHVFPADRGPVGRPRLWGPGWACPDPSGGRPGGGESGRRSTPPELPAAAGHGAPELRAQDSGDPCPSRGPAIPVELRGWLFSGPRVWGLSWKTQHWGWVHLKALHSHAHWHSASPVVRATA